MPCQWEPEKVRLVKWTRSVSPVDQREELFGVFVYTTMSGPWQCECQSQRIMTSDREQDTKLISHWCDTTCIEAPQAICPEYNKPEVIEPMPAVTVNTSVCLAFIGPGLELGNSSCRISVTVRVTERPLVAPKWSAFACGKSAYTAIPINASGICYLAHLIPPSRIVNTSIVHELISSHNSHHHHRKRDVGKVEQWVGVFLTPLGVRDLQKEVEALRKAFELTANQTVATVKNVQLELTATRKLSIQNRMALDLLFASQGGTCKVIGKECCVYVPDATSSVDDLSRVVSESDVDIHSNQGFFSVSVEQRLEELLKE